MLEKAKEGKPMKREQGMLNYVRGCNFLFILASAGTSPEAGGLPPALPGLGAGLQPLCSQCRAQKQNLKPGRRDMMLIFLP